MKPKKKATPKAAPPAAPVMTPVNAVHILSTLQGDDMKALAASNPFEMRLLIDALIGAGLVSPPKPYL